MEKRIFIAVLLSFAILYGYSLIAPRLFPQFVPKKAPVTATSTTGTTSTSAATTTSNTTTAPAAPPAVAPQPAVAATTIVANIGASAEENTRIETPDFIAVFSNRGAELTSFQLKGYRTKSGGHVDLVKARAAGRIDYPFAIVAQNRPVADRLNAALWQVTESRDGQTTIIDYKYANNGVAASKTFRVGPEYMFHFAVAVNPAMPYRVAIGPGIRTLEADEGQSQLTITGDAVVQRDDSLKLIKRDKADPFATYGADTQFIGIEDNYFLSVLKPEKASGAVLSRVEETGAKNEKRHELYAALNATPDGVVSGSAFFGPKDTGVVDKYGLERTLQFGTFGVIARFFLTALKWINTWTHNWGFAIIVLTILIKIVLYPLQHKSIVSMRKMQKLQPKVEAIKSRYKKAKSDPEQRQKMNMDVMKLYQTEGVNPMGGCLPMVLQLPIFWGFYGLLSRAIELRGAPFIWWIHDLSTKDPYYITPILMTITMFVQQTLTPTTVDPAQRRMFMIMPLLFGFFFKELPSGLVIYWLVQNILSIIQQLIMNKWWKDHPSEQPS
ncbi:MAG TPA: membrane protein insertase YidC [Thermoanaerobaculia bacterium]